MRREATMLRDKSMASLRRAVSAFNGMEDDGRETAVLLHLQHAAEMLLKAGLVEKRVTIFNKKSGRSEGFDKCLNLARAHLGLDDTQAGQLRAIDSLRDDEQHWLAELAEELLYAEVRGTVGVLDAVMRNAFGSGLADHVPGRALLAKPPRDRVQQGRRHRAAAFPDRFGASASGLIAGRASGPVFLTDQSTGVVNCHCQVVRGSGTHRREATSAALDVIGPAARLIAMARATARVRLTVCAQARPRSALHLGRLCGGAGLRASRSCRQPGGRRTVGPRIKRL
jgi:hypothetical protein